MNTKTVTAALQPLVDRTISALTDYACLRRQGYVEMCVAEVRHLPPDERIDANEGNVILAKGTVDVQGRPEGLVFWARDVKAVEWEKRGVTLVGACWIEVRNHETERG